MRKKILIIHAHPEEKSFCSSLKNSIEQFYLKQGAEVKISSLYEMQFEPVGGRQDFSNQKDPEYFKYQAEQMFAIENNSVSPLLKEEMDKFEWCDTLVFNFPLWWFSVPAILKGWIDRVFAMGFAYGNGRGVYENGHFKDKIAFLSFTTGGPEVAYGPEGKNGDLEKILYPIQHGVFYFTGMKVYPPFISFSPVRLSDQEREMELERLTNYLTGLEDQKPLFG